MSRAYRIQVCESDRRVIRAADAVSTHLGILEILPAEEMAALLAQELRDRGFVETGSLLRRETNGISATVDPKTGVVTVRAETEDEVQVKAFREGLAYLDAGPTVENIRARLSQQAKADLDKEAARASDNLQQKATEKLEGELLDLKLELDRAVNRVTATALKRKATQMGVVKEIQEDEESGSLTIKLEV